MFDFNPDAAILRSLPDSSYKCFDHHQLYISNRYPFVDGLTDYGYGHSGDTINSQNLPFTRANQKGVFVAGQIYRIDAGNGDVDVILDPNEFSSNLMISQGWPPTVQIVKGGTFEPSHSIYLIENELSTTYSYFFAPKGSTIVYNGASVITPLQKGKFVFVNNPNPTVSSIVGAYGIGGSITTWDDCYRFGASYFDSPPVLYDVEETRKPTFFTGTFLYVGADSLVRHVSTLSFSNNSDQDILGSLGNSGFSANPFLYSCCIYSCYQGINNFDIYMPFTPQFYGKIYIPDQVGFEIPGLDDNYITLVYI